MAGGNASCGVNYFCMGAFLIFVGSVLLCALGFTIVLPYAATRDWPEVRCRVTNTTYNFLQCMCDQQIYEEDLGCITKYPCLEIMVRYELPRSALTNISGLNIVKRRPSEQHTVTPSPHSPRIQSDDVTHDVVNVLNVDEALVNYSHVDDGDAITVGQFDVGVASTGRAPESGGATSTDVNPRSTLPYSGTDMTSDSTALSEEKRNTTVDDVIVIATTLFRWWSDSFYGKCSIHECGVEEWNIKEAARFKSAWGVIGQTYPCYYRPDSPGVVILSKTPPLAVLHAVLWPCFSLLAGWLLWLGLCAGCCSLDKGETYTPDHYR